GKSRVSGQARESGGAAALATRCRNLRRAAFISKSLFVMTSKEAASIHEYPTCSDWAGPFLNLAYDEMLQVFRRSAVGPDHGRADFLQSRMHRRCLDCCDSRPMKL